MLVLTRKSESSPDDCDVIMRTPDGTEMVVRVKEIRRRQVRLGFDAPEDIEIVRAELEDRPRETVVEMCRCDAILEVPKDGKIHPCPRDRCNCALQYDEGGVSEFDKVSPAGRNTTDLEYMRNQNPRRVGEPLTEVEEIPDE